MRLELFIVILTTEKYYILLNCSLGEPWTTGCFFSLTDELWMCLISKDKSQYFVCYPHLKNDNSEVVWVLGIINN